jgi:hypothetical protein
VPAGYSANQTDCVGVSPGGSCTITNTLNSNTIVVSKDFTPNSVATVPVVLTCSSGNVTPTTLLASEATPAVFTVIGALAGATCTATETVAAGYSANQTDCVGVALGDSCTLINTQIQAVAEILALSGWGMILFVALLALLGPAAIRRLAP